MQRIYVCNSFSDSISEIDIDSFKENREIKFDISKGRVGPYRICKYKDYLISANKFSNDISIINLSNKEMKSYYIGANCNDIKIYRDRAFIACGDTNDIKEFDLNSKKVVESIPCGNYPHSIDINEELGLILVCNMIEGTINFIDLFNYSNVEKVYVGQYPTKAIFNKDINKVMVCISELGKYRNGSLKIIGMNFKNIDSINLGKGSFDLCYENNMVYITNFEEGTISIVNLNNVKKKEKIYIGGMPRGIQINNNNIFVGDYYGNYIYKINLYAHNKEKISVGNEPNSLLII